MTQDEHPRQADSHFNMLLPDGNENAHQLSVALNQVAHLLGYDADSSIHRPDGMSLASYRILFSLWTDGPMSPLQVADKTGMKKSAISNLLKPLLAESLIVQEAAENDRRSKVLSLTEKGTEYIQHTASRQNALESEWFSALTDIEQDLLESLLKKLLDSNRASQVRKNRSH